MIDGVKYGYSELGTDTGVLGLSPPKAFPTT